MSYEKRFKKRWRKKLSAAIAVSLLCGGLSAAPALAADYTATLTGDAGKDTQYTLVRQADGNYTFTDDSTIYANQDTVSNLINNSLGTVGAGIYAGSSYNVDAGSHVLNITADFDKTKTTGVNNMHSDAIYIADNQKLTLSAKEINLLAKVTNNGSILWNGDEATGIRAGTGSTTVINGDVSIQTASNAGNGAFGIYANKNASVTVNGNYTAKAADGSVGIASVKKKGSPIYAAAGSSVTINGGVDFVSEPKYGYNYMYVDADDGGKVTIDHGKMVYQVDPAVSYTPNAVCLGNGAVFSLGMDSSLQNANGRDVVLNGDIVSYNFGTGKSTVNLGLGSSNSVFTGLFQMASTDTTNLFLSDGGTWIRKAFGTEKSTGTLTRLAGGSDASHAGIVDQNNEDLTINQYSGDTVFVYNHTKDGTGSATIDGGRVFIESAAAGSHVTMYTDRTGINTDSYDVYKNVLEGLANKLFYDGFWQGENNLSGTVTIADGLTAPSITRTGTIHFDPNDGQGSFLITDFGASSQTKSAFTTTMTGLKNQDSEYVDSGVRKRSEYRFTEDTSITVDDGDAAVLSTTVNPELSGKSVVAGIRNTATDDDHLTVTLPKTKNLTINATATGTDGIAIGLYNGPLQTTTITAGKITINSTAQNGTAYGLYYDDTVYRNNTAISADMVINVQGGGKDSAGIKMVGQQLTINGTVDIKVKDAVAIRAGSPDGARSTVSLSGGNIIAENSSDGTMGVAVDVGSNNAQVVIGNRDTPQKVNLQGAVSAAQGQTFCLWLGTQDSVFHGKVYGDGSKNITLTNGATWINEAYAPTPTGYTDTGVTKLSTLYGSSTSDTRGYLYQKDSDPINVTGWFGNVKGDLSDGYLTVIYDHDKTDPTKISGGGLSLAKGSHRGKSIWWSSGELTMRTDSDGIDVTNKTVTDAVMDALAQKLTYLDYTDGYREVKGYAEIGEGLTTAAVTGRIKFDPTTGQGYYYARPVAPSDQQTTLFDTTIYGTDQIDTQYVEEGVLKASGQYVFTKDSSYITVKDDDAVAGDASKVGGKTPVAAIFAHDNTVGIDATYRNLALSATSTGTDKTSVGVYAGGSASATQFATVQADRLTINAAADGSAAGIYAENGGNVAVTGNTDIFAQSSGNDYGIYAGGNTSTDNKNSSSVSITGDVTIRTGDNSTGTLTGISAQSGTKVSLTGNTTVTVKNGTAMENNGGTVTLTAGTLQAVKADSSFGTAVSAKAGNTYLGMNSTNNGAGTGKLAISGMIDASATGNVYLGLGTSDSVFTGIVNTTANSSRVRMYLNGGTWDNEVSSGTTMPSGYAGATVYQLYGGADAAHAGVIIQKDTNPLTIRNYKGGYTTVLYAHEATTPTTILGGAVKINNALDGSYITLRTDNQGITAGNSDTINAVLNALAGKLYCNTNYVGNLTGTVQIAEGLTAASASKYTGNISFDNNGWGYYQYTSGGGTTTQQKDYFTAAITGDPATDTAYTADHVLNSGTYGFTLNRTSVAVTGGAAVNAAQHDVTVDATGKALSLKGDMGGISAAAGKTVAVTAGTLAVDGGTGAGIAGAGTVTLSSDNDIAVAGSTGIDTSGTVTINGSAAVTGSAGTGISTSGTGSVTVGGGTVTGKVAANGGSIRIGDAAGSYTAAITGDISAADGAAVTAYLWGSDSGVTGNVSGAGAVDLELKNGAVWTGQSSSSNLQLGLSNNGTWKNTGVSTVKTLTGDKGIIDMTGKDAGNVTIGSYSGTETAWYNHDQTTPTTILGGNLTIGSAAASAAITLRTDATGLNVSSTAVADKKLVNDTLNAMAGKLYYTASTSGEQNLSGTVEIAEALTSQSASKSGAIDFTANGQGEYTPGGKEEQSQDSFATAITGDGTTDTEYVNAHVWKELSYKFTKSATTVAVTGKSAVNAASQDVLIDAGSNALSLKSDTAGISAGQDKTVTVTAGTLAIDAGGGTGIAALGNVTVNGTANITAGTNGTAIRTVGLGSVALSDGTISGKLDAAGGTISLNAGNSSKAVVMNGDVGTTAGATVTANLNGSSSALTGSVSGTGSTNLNLSNGAAWTGNASGTGAVDAELSSNSVWSGQSTGGNLTLGLNASTWNNTGASSVNSLKGTAAVVDMTNSAAGAVNIGSYSGDTTFIYKHAAGANYQTTVSGGDVTIGSAAAGSKVTMQTDSDGVLMNDEDSINSVLNALAGKLYYTAYTTGEKNLSGYVKIAEGLTASSAVKQTGSIAFSDTTGQGSLQNGSVTPGPQYPAGQTTDTFTQAMTGDAHADKIYLQAGVLKDGTYTLTKNPTSITVSGANATIDGQSASAAIAAAANDVTVNAAGMTLNLAGTSDASTEGAGIYAANGKTVSVTADTVTLNPAGTGTTTGIVADGNVTIAGNANITAGTGIEAGQNGKVTINGTANITAAGTAVSAASGATVALSDGTIKGNLAAGGGTITVNAANTNKAVAITGNLVASGGGKITVTLNGNGSSLTGQVKHDSGDVTLNLSNGALWTVPGDKLMQSRLLAAAATGGTLTLNGGTSQGSAGYVMNNSSADLKIDNFSGHMVVMYEHSNDGSSASDYTAGNTVIQQAAAGSGITLSTESEGLDMSSNDTISKTLGLLTSKLYYANAASDKNLTGNVQIAEGLTVSSAAKQVGTVNFENTTGQGSYASGSITPGVGADIVYGPKETAMMRGAKSAMTTSMLTWRANTSDMTERLGDLRYGAEEGIWARTFGGKVKYDAKNTYFKNSFWGVQIGADHKLNSGWYVGGGVDYIDGNSSYEMGGSGDPKLYTASVYGTKLNADGQYVDIVLKTGQVKNDYTVYNDMGHKLKGNYNSWGTGLSAEYGKRFTKANSYIEPQIQMTVSRLNGADYNATSDFSGGKQMHVSQDGMTSLIGRLGITAGKTTQRSSMYAKLGLLHEFSGNTKSTFSAANEPTSSIGQNFKDTWAELALGGTYRLSSASMMYGDLVKSFGGDYNLQYKVNAGIRFTF
ncbi:MAG: hypothetical protein ABFC84_12530 [Veillonellales bacterium]